MKIQVILGPTSSGKTDLAIQLAQKNNGAVISADSRQVYAGMNIGTAKPKEAWGDAVHAVEESDDIDGVPHYFLNIRRPDNPYSLADWKRDLDMVLADLDHQKQQAIIAGGTMLYIDSIVKNFLIPVVAPNAVLRQELEQQDVATLYKRLLERDPGAERFIEPHHKQRIIRALEVIAATGQPFSAQRQQQPSPHTFSIIGLFPGWDALRQRIEARAQAMLEGGLLEETQRLINAYSPALPLLKTMNYLQAAKILAGQMTQQEALEEMIRVNMRYAHRQMSWWKNRSEIRWFATADQAFDTI